MEWFYKCAHFILSDTRWAIRYSRSCISARFILLYLKHDVDDGCWWQQLSFSVVTNIDFQLMVWVHLYHFHWFKQSFLVHHIQVSWLDLISSLGYIDVGDFILIISLGCWGPALMFKDRASIIEDVGDKTAKTVTNISKLSPTHFVSNIRHQHRSSRRFSLGLSI